MSDLINRQDAIDALSGLDISDGMGISCIASGVQYSAIRAIEDLPSAEPEIIRCKDCKHYTNEFGWNGEEYTFCSFCSEAGHHRSLVSADDFCSRAERRTDE